MRRGDLNGGRRQDPLLALDWLGYEELNRRAFRAYHGAEPRRILIRQRAAAQCRNAVGRFRSAIT